MSHTPGPWKLDHRSESLLGSNGEHVRVYGSGLSLSGLPDPESVANARLIAAAPELLEACKVAIGAFEHNNCIDWNIFSRAIRKATGGAL